MSPVYYKFAEKPCSLEVRSVENDAHKTTTGDRGDGDRKDPAQEDPAKCPPVDSLPAARDESDTGGGTHDAHGGGDWEGVLRGKQDSDGRSKLHGETSGWRHEGDSVTDSAHDLVSVSGETDDDHRTTESQGPGLSRGVLGEGSVLPDVVDSREWTDGIGSVVGTVGEGVGAGGKNLEEGEQVFGLVTVLRGLLVHESDTFGLGRSTGTTLHVVDVDSGAVQQTSEELVSEEDPDVLGHVPASNDRVLVLLLLNSLERGRLKGCGGFRDGGVLSLDVVLGVTGERSRGGELLFLSGSGVSANNTVVRDESLVESDLGGLSLPKERTVEEVVPSDGVVLLDDLGVDVRKPEEKGENADDDSSEDDGEGDGGFWQLGEVETWGTLVHWVSVESLSLSGSKLTNGHGEHSRNGEEVERGHQHGGLDRVLPLEHGVLGDQVDDGTETTSKCRGNDHTGPNGGETLSAVPAPCGCVPSANSDTDTSERGDKRVSGGNGPRVPSGDHEPSGRSDERAGESQHGDGGVTLEDIDTDDGVLDRSSDFGTDKNGTEEFTDGSDQDRLSHGQ